MNNAPTISEKEIQSSITRPLGVVSLRGVWSLVRDRLHYDADQSLPTWFILNFFDVREAAQPAGSNQYNVSEKQIREAYGSITNKYPELKDLAAVNAIIELELSLCGRLLNQAISREYNASEAACLVDDRVSFYQLYAGSIGYCLSTRDQLTPTYELGASFAAPLFYGFVHRLMIQAEEDGVRRLYFLARDGQLLLEIAKSIQANLGFESLELRYLYVSRQAIRFPSIIQLSAADLKWIFEEMDNALNLHTIALRIRMSCVDLRKNLKQDLLNILPADDDSLLSIDQASALRKFFLEDLEIRQSIHAQSKASRDQVIQYFEQEGLFEYNQVGFVDVGWKGTLQDAIHRITYTHNRELTINEYYFGVSEYSPMSSPKNKKTPFFLFPTSQPGFGPLFESLLLADHGMTLDYTQNVNGEWSANTKPADARFKQWGLDDYFDGIRDFSEAFSQSLAEFGSAIELHYHAIVPALIDLLAAPTKEMSECLGELPYSGNQEESNLRKMAPPFSVSDALRYWIRSEDQRRAMTHWRKATMKRSSLISRILLRFDPRKIAKGVARVFIAKDEVAQLRARNQSSKH
ncbi:MAG: hypothetical protein ACSHX4_12755 [Opitutaceae bacterium]